MTIALAETTTPSLALPRRKIGEEVIYYPESDGKPMGETAVHIKQIISLFQVLETYYTDTPDVCIIADMMFYYEEGNPRKVISPDVMVVKEVGNYNRRVFKLWEEKTPDVVFEISSRDTWRDDLQKKHRLYESFGVKEYYVFDPEYDYLPEPLLAYHLKNSFFKPMKVKKGKIFSPSLNLEIVDTGVGLRLFNPRTKSFLLTNEELAKVNESLAQNTKELAQNNEELTKYSESLTHYNEELKEYNEDLTEKLSQSAAEIEKLKAELAKLKEQK